MHMDVGRFTLPVALTAVAALALAGCATSEPAAPVERPRPSPVLPVAPAISAAVYVAAASSLDLFAIRSSELALARASDPRLRDFARMVEDAHEGTSAQLSFAGRRLNLLPSASLLPEHQAMLDALAASPDFDNAYRRQQLKVHEEALSLHSGYARSGTSPTLRPVAAAAVPIVQRHLARLRSIR
jgi:putative membrane protein